MAEEPIVWDRFTVEKNGKTLQIRLQQIRSDLFEPCVDHVVDFFLEREPTTSYIRLKSDLVSLEELKQLWRDTLKDGAGIVAIVENDPNAPPFNIIGLNLTGISKKEKENHEWKGKCTTKIVESVVKFSETVNIFERYGVDRYLTALGLSVHPQYHGIGLGLKLLQAREKICATFGLKVTATVFTAAASQYLAKKAGFSLLAETDYLTYEVDGRIPFPKLEGTMALMAKEFV